MCSQLASCRVISHSSIWPSCAESGRERIRTEFENCERNSTKLEDFKEWGKEKLSIVVRTWKEGTWSP